MIGSQAAIAEPRETLPSPTARARVPARWSATPTTAPPDHVVAPVSPDRRLRRGQPEAIDELRLLVRPQEQIDRRVAPPEAGAVGLTDRATGQDDAHRRVGRLEPGQLPHPADDLLLGALADRTGVDDDEIGGLEAGGLLAARAVSRRPAISSESLRFIWQPSVQTWKRGRVRDSGTYSVRRRSAGSAGRRGTPGAGSRASSSIGRARVAVVVDRSVMVVPASLRRRRR